MACIALQLPKHFSFKRNIAAQLRKENELDIFVEFKVSSSLLSKSFQLSDQFLDEERKAEFHFEGLLILSWDFDDSINWHFAFD